MNESLKYAAFCVRHPLDLRGLLRGATLRDLVLRRDLVRLGMGVPLVEARGLGAATFKASLVPRLRSAVGELVPRTVLDVGAQYGQFARAALFAFPGSRVYAFEPLSGSFPRLREALRGRADALPFQVALGDADGEAEIHVSANPGSSSLLPMDEAHVRAFPGTAVVRAETIRVRRLDSMVAEGLVQLAGPVLMKVDVQGFEERMFAGCGVVLDRVDAIIVEMSLVTLYQGQTLAAGVRALLESRGFRYEGEFDRIQSATTGELVQVDGLFRRR